MGHAQSFRWKDIVLAYPTDYNITVEAIHWARMTAKDDTNTITILIFNHNAWTPQQFLITTKGDIYTLITIPPHTIQYKPTPEWPKYYHYVEPLLLSVICIRSQTNLGPNLRTPHELPHILKEITNIHIDTYPVKPTISNYHVKFSNT